MYFIKSYKLINIFIELFQRVRLWHRGYEPTVIETGIKLFYSIYYLFFPISLLAGAFQSDSSHEFIFLLESTLMSTVALLKLLHIMWKKKEIVEFLNTICIYSIKDQEVYVSVNRKLELFMKAATYFFVVLIMAGCTLSCYGLFDLNEKKLYFNIGFPLDYNNSEIAYWLAFAYSFIQINLSVIAILYSIIVWFLLFNCGLKYEVLGGELRNMGVIDKVGAFEMNQILQVEPDHLFHRDLIAGIKSYNNLNKSTNRVGSFLSNILAMILATSGLCICTSVYCLAYINNDKFIEKLVYIAVLFTNVFDVFMVTYYANEIRLLSDRLSFCLFESNWIDSTQSCKKSMIIFGEHLIKEHQLVVLKTYPLTLEIFTRILNSAYSMFYILKQLS